MSSSGIYRILNPVMTGILNSPLHPMASQNVMLINFTGRKSGKHYTTPVSYYRDNGSVYCFSHGNWWKNFRGGKPVDLRIQGKDYAGMANPITDDKKAIAEVLGMMLRQVPRDAQFYDVSLDEHGEPDSEDLLRAAETAVMIRIDLE